MNLLIRFLSRLSASKDCTVEPVIKFNNDWKTQMLGIKSKNKSLREQPGKINRRLTLRGIIMVKSF